MWVSRYFLWFLIYSMWGWMFEALYCTLKSGVWENRGFLYGPFCPIYGVGAIAITGAYHVMDMEMKTGVAWWQFFLMACIGSAVLEYITSYVLEKVFHAYWWDYSDMPLNLNGRICLPASLLFGCMGLLIIYVTDPFFYIVTDFFPPAVIEAFSLLAMAYLSMDATLTISALTQFQKQVANMEAILNQHMEDFISSVQGNARMAAGYLTAERERFSAQHIEMFVKSMNGPHRAALRRVAGFKQNVSGAPKALLNPVLQFIRKYNRHRITIFKK